MLLLHAALLAVASMVLVIPLAYGEPMIRDDGLVLERYVSESGWGFTAMTFVDNDILVLEKNGNVRLVKNGTLQPEPVHSETVYPVQESGLLGITSRGSAVYLYLTEADASGNPLGNRIYRYDWDGGALVNRVLVKELPSNDYHNGGAMLTGDDGQIYAVIGDTGIYGPLQNKDPNDVYPPGITDYLDTSVILRVDPPGSYHAIGIRNSFGLAIDPKTGSIWATENGDDNFDEINMVPEWFNSGWIRAMGPATAQVIDSLPVYENYTYGDPKFTWEKPVAPTAIEFGAFHNITRYDSSVFVGDCNNGNLYKFELDQNRESFVFDTPKLQDGLADSGDSLDEIIIGTGFKCITDIERGPDGLLYIASFGENSLYRLLPAVSTTDGGVSDNISGGGGCLIATAAYGTEMAPQIQRLRDVRDNLILEYASGAAFMSGFNQIYYSFSPTVADWERQSPAFREAVRMGITPLLLSLSIMEGAPADSEPGMIAYGVVAILLGAAIYVGPIAGILWVTRWLRIRMRHSPVREISVPAQNRTLPE